MSSPDLPRPSFGALLAEQVPVVALALRREALLAGAALAVICSLTVLMGLRYDEQLDLSPDMLQPVLLVAILAPFAVWKGDPIFGQAFLWTAPVRRQTAAVAKILAGAFWLMAAILVALVALALSAMATGGHIGIAEIRLVETGSGTATARVAWATPFWTWLTSFVGALLLYLASSAALLGFRHPIRWFAGVVIGLTLLMFIGVGVGPDGAFEQAFERVVDPLTSGSFGLDFALTGGSVTLAHGVDRPGPGYDTIWHSLPSVGRWLGAALVWLAAVLLLLALAIRRHWER